MTLKEFIQKFVCKNTIIRLWKPTELGDKMLVDTKQGVCMEWEIIQNKVPQNKYLDCKVKGVSDIFVEGSYIEAVNIVLDI